MSSLLNPQIDHIQAGDTAVVSCAELVDLLLDMRNELRCSWRDLSAASEPIRVIDRHLRTIRRFKRVAAPEAQVIVNDVAIAMLEASLLDEAPEPATAGLATTGRRSGTRRKWR